VAVLPPPNSVINIYRGFSGASPYPSPSATPAATGVAGHLRHHVRNGRFGSAVGLHWTHIIFLPDGVDLRSAYNSELNAIVPANADTVLVPDYPLPGWCTAFYVVLVQRVRGEEPFLRVCLDRMQPRLGGCTSGIVLPCCPVALPATIHATVPAGSGCPCMDGTVVALTYSAITQSWSGSAAVCFGDTLTITFKCGSTSCGDATLNVNSALCGSVGPVKVNPGCSCNPLNMVFSGVTFPHPGSECFGPIRVVITA
jgi:hypothetical protein